MTISTSKLYSLVTKCLKMYFSNSFIVYDNLNITVIYVLINE